jgi:hypothetical protein
VQAARAELEIGELELLGHATQVETDVDPADVEYVPAPQSVHAALSVKTLYLPVTQAVHVPPLGPVNPTLQVQLASAVLPAGELTLAGQARQVVADVAFTVCEKVLAEQAVHSTEPLASL